MDFDMALGLVDPVDDAGRCPSRRMNCGRCLAGADVEQGTRSAGVVQETAVIRHVPVPASTCPYGATVRRTTPITAVFTAACTSLQVASASTG